MINIAALGLYMLLTSVSNAPQAITAPIAVDNSGIVVENQKKESTEEVDKNVEAYVRNYFKDIPILAEVSRCESGFRQFGKDGKVLRGMAVPADVGVMQINEKYHGARAKKLGYDIYTLDGNLGYARYLYEHGGDNGDSLGNRPWLASAPCWGKIAVNR